MIIQQSKATESVNTYFYSENSDFKDPRLLKRFELITSHMTQDPRSSFPTVFKNKADLEGFYRFMNNDRVHSEDLFDNAAIRTTREAPSDQLVLAIHDTTCFDFTHTSEVKGLGRLSQGKQGFFGHFCIAANMDREIFGILGVKTWTRNHELRKKKPSRTDPTRESLRWLEMFKEVHNRFEELNPAVSVLHVADREADDYATFHAFNQLDIRFIFRAKFDRKVVDPIYSKLFESLQEVNWVCQREVQVSARKSKFTKKKINPNDARKKRVVKLGISAKEITIGWTANVKSSLPKTIALNFVRVFEIDPPLEEVPIEWILITTESIQNEADILQIVDAYRARWTIEEYFKALKTGCSFEKRGLESLSALLRCLAIFAPIACQLYNLKTLGRQHPEKSTSSLATPIQIKILAHHTKQSENTLSTVGPFMQAIAAMGGHLKHNGPPGWQVLARGYEMLLKLEAGYLLALSDTYAPSHL